MNQSVSIGEPLQGELQKLGVIPKVDEDGEITLFCLLYPENAKKLHGKKDPVLYSQELLVKWMNGRDWQSYVAEAVERRKLDGKVVEELVK